MPRVVEAEQRWRHHRYHHNHQHPRRRWKGGSRGGAGYGTGRKKDREVVVGGVKSPPRPVNPVSNGGRSCGNTNSRCGSSGSLFFSEGDGDLEDVLPTASAWASDRRCSFGSDREARFPRLANGLAGFRRCRSSGQVPDQERRPSFDSNTQHASKEADSCVGRGEEKVEGQRQEITVLDPAKHSLLLALRECQNRRFRSEGFPSPATARRQQKGRPVSLDLNGHMSDTSTSSPGSFGRGGLKKTSVTLARSSMFPSPVTPNYRHGSGVVGSYQKGWSSERVPLPMGAGRSTGRSAVFLPFGNGKLFPSKWDDAEKWICSPVSGDGIRQLAVPPHHRRPKSKSGPLGTPAGIGGCYSSASPSLPGFGGGRAHNFTLNSPFMAGVLVADHGLGDGNSDGGANNGVCGRRGRSQLARSDHSMVRSVSVHGWSDPLVDSSSSLPNPEDEVLENVKEGAATVSSIISRKDMATQMSPEGSIPSSTRGWPQQSSHLRPSYTNGELQCHPKFEVRDVQVDDQGTVTGWSKKHVARGLDKTSAGTTQWKMRSVESPSLAWEITEAAKCTSRSKRVEAKITAWENLQKAKAEAAIQKLEMKLEKKRSSSLDKILKKLGSAQRKAQDMRNAVSANQKRKVRSPRKALIFHKTSYVGYLSGCFTCRTF